MNYYITGTDTGVGKTLISCALLRAFAASGITVAGMKPVAAGCDADGLNEDVKKLRAATTVMASLGQINPYSFERAIAPHIAAHDAGVSINLDRILESYRELAAQADVVIVEGAGGFLVPLNQKQDSSDLAVTLELPVILVVGIRLGCLNHALLTVSAITGCELACAGWVANIIDADMQALEENIQALKERIKAPMLGIVKFQHKTDVQLAAASLDITLLEATATENTAA